jgi:hemolysin III
VFSLFALYSTSASYHLFTRAPHVQKIMQKLDHSMIFILIAGTYTPLCLLALPHSWGIPFLCFVWAAAIMGMVFKFGWGARRITGGLYIALGWAGVFIFPTAAKNAGSTAMVLLGIGGVLYTVGAILFYLQRPRLVPHIFGYHEIWHVFTVLAGITQFIGIGFIVAQAN